jgi:nicotinic acid phosphoribosyltransferase
VLGFPARSQIGRLGIEAGIAAARLSVMVGFVGTSNVEAARLYGLRPVGTMAHGYIEAFSSEREAFRAFAHDFPAQTALLVDTYDTMAEVEHAIEVVPNSDWNRPPGYVLIAAISTHSPARPARCSTGPGRDPGSCSRSPTP